MKLTSIEFLIVTSGVILGFLMAWLGLMHYASKHKAAMLSLFEEGNLLRMVTVGFIIAAVSLLAVIDKLSAEVVSVILSGIAGYVLGGMKVSDKRKVSELTGTSATSDPTDE